MGDGSSPRVRGTPGCPIWQACCCRFIPACAGNTRRALLSNPALTVHPRVCGEHSNSSRQPGQVTGSSPRVRGTHDPRASGSLEPRFIPACAGNTSSRLWLRSDRSVHPRVCGEHDEMLVRSPDVAGSSPRVRGTHRLSHPSALDLPSCSPHTRGSRPPVHPRVCGEHRASEPAVSSVGGSSPRVRGTQYRRGSIHARPTVHPRVCGEHTSKIIE